MPDPITIGVFSGFSAAASTIVSTSKLLYALNNTPTDVKTCLSLVQRVDRDIQFAVSLRNRYLPLLSKNSNDLQRLNQIIAGAEESILDIGRLLEGCRAEANQGKVPLAGRMRWVLGDSAAFATRTGNLQQQHSTVLHEISFLRTLEDRQCLKNLRPNTTFENMEFFPLRDIAPEEKAMSHTETLPKQPPPAYASTLSLVPLATPPYPDPRGGPESDVLPARLIQSTISHSSIRPTQVSPRSASTVETQMCSAPYISNASAYPTSLPYPEIDRTPLKDLPAIPTQCQYDIGPDYPLSLVPGRSNETAHIPSRMSSPTTHIGAEPLYSGFQQPKESSSQSVSHVATDFQAAQVTIMQNPPLQSGASEKLAYSDLILADEQNSTHSHSVTPSRISERLPEPRSSYSSYSSSSWLYASGSGPGSSVQSPNMPYTRTSSSISSCFSTPSSTFSHPRAEDNLRESIAPEVIPDLYTLPSFKRSNFTLSSEPASEPYTRPRSETQQSWAASTDTLVSRPASAVPSEWHPPPPPSTQRSQSSQRKYSLSTSQWSPRPTSITQDDMAWTIPLQLPKLSSLDEDPETAFFQSLRMVEEERRRFRDERGHINDQS